MRIQRDISIYIRIYYYFLLAYLKYLNKTLLKIFLLSNFSYTFKQLNFKINFFMSSNKFLEILL